MTDSRPTTRDTAGDSGRLGSQASADDAATVAVSSRGDDRPPPDPGLTKKIGRHVVLEQVGRGGMGSVYRAYDPKLQREVALKRLRAKAMGEAGRARFEHEARAMAKLSHPNVVAVYDVEALPDGQLVLVMEYVDGPTLRNWLRQASRPWSEVLEPFLGAGRGLAAAHRAGLLHRDFKPANVLVTDEHAKVTDFGLAKRAKDSTGSSRRSHSDEAWEAWVEDDALTRAGEVMGTPRYMAPEQHRGLELDHAVDQFSYCVALWEALAQEAPYAGPDMGQQKLQGPPAWSSAFGPRWLGEVIRRGLAPDPEDRWPNMDELLAALSRDPKARARSLVRGTIVVGLMTVAGGAAYAARRDHPGPCSGAELQLQRQWGDTARQAVRAGMTSVDVVYAKDLHERVDRRLDEYAQSWIGEYEAACEAGVRQEHSQALTDLRVGCLDRGRVAFGAVIDVLTQADVDTLRNVDTMIDTLPELTRCNDLAALQEGTDPPSADEATPVERVRETLALAKVDRLAGHFDHADSKLEQCERQLEAIDYIPVRGEFQFEQAELLRAHGKLLESEDAYRIALRLAVESKDWALTAEASSRLMSLVGKDLNRPQEVLVLQDVAESAAKDDPLRLSLVFVESASVLSESGKHEAAERRAREALALLADTVGPNDQRIARARNTLGAVLVGKGQLSEGENEYRTALALLTESLGPDHPNTALVRGNLAQILRRRGQLDEAEREARFADAARLRSLGPKHVLYGSGKVALSEILADTRRFEESEAEARKAIDVVESAVGRRHAKTATAINALGRVLMLQGKPKPAEDAFREALEIRTEVFGEDHPRLAGLAMNIAVTLRRQNRLEEAEVLYKDAIRIWTQAFGPDYASLGSVHQNLGNLYLDMERYQDSKAQTERAIALFSSYMQPGDMGILGARANLSEALMELGDSEAAIRERRGVLEGFKAQLADDHPHVAMARSRLARALSQIGQHDEALELSAAADEKARKEGLSPAERGQLLMTRYRIIAAHDPSPTGLNEAREVAQQALQHFVQAGVDGEAEAQETRDWLAEHPG